jgi:DNA-binding CsgD family transcriptional regulator
MGLKPWANVARHGPKRQLGGPIGSLHLTANERRILEFRASGLDRNEIARLLHRSPQTISNSLTIAKEKLGAQSLTQAAILLTQAAILLAASDPGSSGSLLS